jgi:glycosyltransferase involved in cell wall biosynthesis
VSTGRRLRVATIITRLEGGAGVQAFRGARALCREAVEQTIVTGSGNGLLSAAAEAGFEVIVEPSLRAPVAPASDLSALRRLTALLRERSFDVVHTHCAKAGAVGRLAARRAGTPRIVHTFHGFPFHSYQSAVRRQAYISIERRLGCFTDIALCVGAGVAAEAVRRELIAPERVRTIGVAVENYGTGPEGIAARMPDARRRARQALGLPPWATVVGAVGRLCYQKAPEDFIAAMRKLARPGVCGIWVGDGELARRMAHLARTLTGTPVVFAGERSDVLEILPAFDVFVLSSRYEGLPTVVVEAMTCGVPVVATAVNAVPDVVVPGETGLLVPPSRPDLLAEAVRYLLDSPQTAARMAQAAQARLGDSYSAERLADALAAAYLAGCDVR